MANLDEPCAQTRRKLTRGDVVYVEDVDQTVERAIAGGAQALTPAQNQFWGDRTASIMDPAGHVWTIATRIEETSEQVRKDRWSGILTEQDRA